MSELALKLIAENKRTRSTFLDLGNCGLTAVPKEIAELPWLESLTFATDWSEWDGRELQLKLSRNQGPQNENLSEIGPLSALHSLQSLYLSGTQVSDLTPLARLLSLHSLDLTGTQVSDLTPLAGLPSLHSLDLIRTHVCDLTPLASLPSLQSLYLFNTQVSDLTPLAGLPSLRWLGLDHTQVCDLTPLARLPSLRWLYLGNTQVSDLTPLAALPSLQSLDLRSTQVSDLTPLASLLSLQWLSLDRTQVSDLTPLAALPSLQYISLSGSLVSSLLSLRNLIAKGLSAIWSRQQVLRLGDGIYVEGCPLTTPPPEIVQQGNAAILSYFDELDKSGVDHLYEAKMLILGEGGAGKTSLLRRLYQRDLPLPAESESTKGISIYRHTFPLKNGRTFRLNVWDFGGQEIYHATHQFFLTHRSLYVLVDDTRKDHKSVSDEGFKYWLELIDVFGGHSPVLIFQNEKAGRSKAIDLSGIRSRFDNVVHHSYAGNLEHPGAADAVRDAIEFYAASLPHIGEELPAPWIHVRAAIEARAAETPYIPQQEYFDIYARHIEFDRAKALHLSRYLHDLGVFLHFQDDPLLSRTVILQNEWATAAVFRILDDEAVKKNLGRFTRADCERLWRDSAYGDMHPELLALMQKFELCYELRDLSPQTWLATQLLPPSKPAVLQDWGQPGDLILRYRYDFLPKGILSRLTVRLHRFVCDPEKAWVTGVLFERAATAVLVELLPGGNEIELRARGPERKELLSVVAADLDALNDSFQGLKDKVDKRIPCNCTICSRTAVPEFYAHKELLKRKHDHKLKRECPASYEDVDVLELLDGIRVETPPAWAKDERQLLQTIRLFLASSAELRADRDEFDRYFRERNDELLKQGLYLQIIRWENFLDAMSDTRLQEEYNKAIRECDIFVCLFFTKTGKFTDEEFEVAHRQFQDGGKPRIWTYFKNADIKTGSARREDLQSLWAFRDKLKDKGHYYTEYNDIEHLKRQFRDQLDKLLSGGYQAKASSRSGA